MEGLREVRRAHQAGVDLKELFLCRDLLGNSLEESGIREIASRETRVFEVSEEIFAKISFGERREGLLAVARPRMMQLKDLELPQKPAV